MGWWGDGVWDGGGDGVLGWWGDGVWDGGVMVYGMVGVMVHWNGEHHYPESVPTLPSCWQRPRGYMTTLSVLPHHIPSMLRTRC